MALPLAPIATKPPMNEPISGQTEKPRWLRWVWLAFGALSLTAGLVGIVLPVLPTTPFVLLAAFCFSRGSQRYEHWLLAHPRFGPMVRDWRAHHAVPLGAKRLAWAMMAVSSVVAWWFLPARVGWIPGVCCGLVTGWMWQLPSSASQVLPSSLVRSSPRQPPD